MPFFTFLYFLAYLVFSLSTQQMPGNMSCKEHTATKDTTKASAIAKNSS
jgi:hypothetical protein